MEKIIEKVLDIIDKVEKETLKIEKGTEIKADWTIFSKEVKDKIKGIEEEK